MSTLNTAILAIKIKRWALLLVFAFIGATVVSAATFTITNCNDSGAGSLRQAITDANGGAGPHTIAFNIPNTDPGYVTEGGVSFWKISPTTALPALTSNNVTIDGATQTANQGDSNLKGPEVMLSGAGAGTVMAGLSLEASYCRVSGLIVSRYNSSASACGIYVFGANNVLTGNYIGCSASGESAAANNDGVYVVSADNLIGGLTVADRNLISGNARYGVVIGGPGVVRNVVVGNYIGVTASGEAALANGTSGYAGIVISNQAQFNRVGSTEAAGRNIISGNNGLGIRISGASSNEVYGNYIGAGASGTTKVANNMAGIYFDSTSGYNLIGSSVPGGGNVLSGNTNQGILFYSGTLVGNRVIGNLIGCDKNGTAALANATGISFYLGTNTVVGDGTVAGRNIIAGNTGNGVFMSNVLGSVTGTRILGNYIGVRSDGGALGNGTRGIAITNGPQSTLIHNNSIANNGTYGVLVDGGTTLYNTISRNSLYSNADVGISLANGGNNSLTAPTIESAVGGAGTVTGEAPANAIVEVFSTGAPDGSGAGEGRTFLGSTEADGSGQWSMTVSLTGGTTVTATATDTSGNTSAFAANLIAEYGVSPYEVTNTNDSGTGSLRQVITNVNANPGSHTVTFNIPNDQSTTEGGVTFWRIKPATELPTLTRSETIISGSSQPTDEAHNNPYGPEIMIDNSLIASSSGLIVEADYCTFEGLVISNCLYGDGAGGYDRGFGIHFHYNADHNKVIGCYIGTDPTGTARRSNEHGLDIRGSFYNRIEGNVISGSSGWGLVIEEGSASNEVLGNDFGCDPSGTISVRNGGGLVILNSSYNQIGDGATAGRNLFSGNSGPGMEITGTAYYNVIRGNYVGTTASGEAPLANNEHGVKINNNAAYNRFAGNLISGNTNVGLYFDHASSNEVLGNYVGCDLTGERAIPNDHGFIVVESFNNLFGDGTPAGRNVISGNATRGLSLNTNAINNQILGNYIGCTASGEGRLPNAVGLLLIDAASSNQVGNGTVGGRNIISGNNGHGFEIGGNSHYNKVHGNYIGLNAGGTGAIGNGQNGLQLVSGPQYNQIGSTEAARRNVISGNGSTGIVIGNYASSNEVLGNYIGTDPAGTAAVANNNDGIHVEGADCFDNRIGDGTVSGRNLVAGNREQGIYLYGVSNNYVLGNYVGCTLNGNVRLPNWSGLVIVDGAKNHVGNGTAGGRNLFSGNNNCGIEMYGTNSNEVLGNYIGVDASGTAALANNSHGIFMNGRYYNRIGDGTPGGRNLISGNGGSGLFLQNYIGYFGPPHDNRILGNYIGLGSNEVVIGNGQYGISLSSDSAGNLIGQDNKIAGNSQGGIRIADANSQYNTITQNSLFGNNGPGIILTNGSNNGLAAPVITSAGIEPVTGSTEVRGTAPAGSTIELFTTGSQNPSGYYEGRTYVASTVESGGWVFVLPPLAAGTTLCATATDANGNTSQFSAAATAAGWPTVALIAPNGGELWSKDANESISWSYSGVPGLKINLYYSLDGGITYPHLITTEANNSSPYTWHTPDVETNEARVRIEAVKVGYITSDESTANFSLTAPILQVINTNDDGEGSLRQVMTYANTLPGFTRVTFNIPNGLATTEGGVKFWRIKPISGPLPAITREGIVIDGTTQPTDETYNNPFGPEIVLDGLAVSGSGLEITAAYCTIEGLVVNRFGDYGIYLNQAAHGDVLGNFIGTDASGTIAQGNSDGIRAKQSPYARIGDGTTTGRNLISGNSSAGIRIHDGSPSSEVKGNYVGTDVSGAVPLGNAEGVRVGNSGYVLIGGSLTGEGNLISGNNGRGIVLGNSGAQYIRIRGNLIGTNVSGTAALQNGSDGIYCFNNSSRNQIGGVTTGEGNLISGNNENGIFFDDDEGYNEVLGNIIGGNASGTIAVPNRLDGIRVRYSTDNRVGNGTAVGRNLIIGNESYDVNTGSAGIRLAGDTFNTIVRGNYIGTDISGTAGLGTFVEGIRLGQNTGCRIGGRNSGEGNVIYGCVRKGIAFGNNTQRTTVEGNTIWHNKGSGIAFEDRGSCSLNTIGPANTIAHNGDGSSPDQYGIWIDGANNIRNTITRNSFYDNYDQAIKLTNSGNANLSAPTIITAEGGSGLVTGEAPANSVVELYLTGAPDPTGSGEGRTYIGSVEANGSGQWSITLVGLTARTTLTATATDTNGNTSAFAVNLVTVQGISPYEVTNTNDSGDGSLRQCILNANANPGSHTITFNIPNSASTTEGGVTFWRIAAPWTQLDVTRAGTVIDGTTQPTDEAHHNPYGPEIVLAQVGEFGGWYNAAINLHADHCTVEGLNIAGAFDGGYGFGYGIFLDNTRGCHIIGNYLGTNPTGEGIGGNSMDGVYISGGSGNVIGGSAPGEGNLISSNFVSAIIFDSTSSNEVRGNYIGTDRTGQRRLDAHLYGAIQLLNDSFGNLIGGAGSGERNIISGSGADALSLTGNARGNLIIGNYIGLGSGEEELGNVGDGVQCDGSGVKYNTVSRNRIYGNVGEAILLSGGANESIAAPAITSAIFNGDTGSIEVIGTVTAAGTIELFLAGPRGYPEGRTFLAATAESGGSWRIDLPNLASGTALSATVTDVNGNTSQFSAVALVSGPPVATVVSPNGGESYRRDSDQLISWSYAGVPGGKINLYYSLDNGASYPFTITTEAENASPYTWHTPDLETTEARVRIEAVLGSYINTDESNAKFSIVTPVLVVNRTANSGEGSLRQVITYANTLPGFYRVTFNIPTSEATFDGGVYYWKIMPTSPLPVIARAGVVVDGTTQPTDETYNNPLGPEIVLDGTMAGPTSGLVVSGVTHCTIEGLTINRFAAGESGIRLNSAGSCEVYGCYLGTNATGTAAAPNVYGLTLNSSPHCVLGAPGRGNRISGNYSTGLSVSNSDDLTMLGNYLGTNAAGTQRLPNSYGAYFSNSSGCRIGDGTPGGRNVFAGNNAPEVALNGSNNVIQGNYFGLGVNGEALGNTAPGLMIDSGSNNLIGPGNVFANHVYGVGAFAPNGNVITRNSFYNHYAIGIGSNQTAPQGLYAGINPLTGSLEVGGTATANGTIELYEAVGPTPWAQAYEGKVYLDSTYEASGAWKFVYSPDFLTQGTTLTATVTTANGTSMFANKTYVYGLPTVEVTVPAAGGSYPNGFDLALNWVVRGVPLDTVNIYYSLDGGATYPYTITREAVNNLSYNWPVPVVNTDEARIKVEAMKGSYTTTTESGIFTILTPVLKVTNTADSGEGSLRQVLTYANTLPGFYRVTFDLPTSEATVAGGAAYWRITPASQLPTLGRDGIVIDGTTQPARGSFYNPYGPEIVIDGQDTVDIGIPIQASACTVEGLVIHRFTANGIYIGGVSNCRIAGNYIGTDHTGIGSRANAGDGALKLENSVSTLVENNVISGNTNAGFDLTNASGSRIVNNYIGCAANGVSALANGTDGINLNNNSAGNLVGANNRIWFNTRNGVRIDGGSTAHNTISQASIYGNGEPGIILENGANEGILAPTIVAANVIPGLGLTEITGEAVAGATIELFATGTPDPSGSGEGWGYLGSTYEASGVWTIQVSGLTRGATVTATATNNNNTSQFAANFTAAANFIPLSIARAADTAGSDIVVSWDEPAVPDIYLLTGAGEGVYTDATTGWTKVTNPTAAGFTQSGSELHHTAQVRGGTTESYYKALPAGADIDGLLSTEAVGKFNISLTGGNNLFSLPLIPDNTAIGGGATLGSQLFGLSPRVYKFEPLTGYTVAYESGGSWAGSLTTLAADSGYWIKLNGARVITVIGRPSGIARSIPIKGTSRSNLLGSAFPRTVGLAATALNSALTTSDKVYGYRDGSFQIGYYTGANTWGGSLNAYGLEPGRGYWGVKNSSGDAVWVYPKPY